MHFDEQLAIMQDPTFLIVFVVLFEDFCPLRPLLLLRTDPFLINCCFSRKIVFDQGACWQLKKILNFLCVAKMDPAVR